MPNFEKLTTGPTPEEIEDAEKELHMAGRAMRVNETPEEYKQEREESWEEEQHATETPEADKPETEEQIEGSIQTVLGSGLVEVHDKNGKLIFDGSPEQMMTFWQNGDYGEVDNIGDISDLEGKSIIRFGAADGNGFLDRNRIGDIFKALGGQIAQEERGAKDQEKMQKVRESLDLPLPEAEGKTERQETDEDFDQRIREDYYRISEEYYTKVEKNSPEEVERALERTRNANFETGVITKALIDKMYRLVRLHDYPMDENHQKDIDQRTGQSSNKVYSQNENGWHYRHPIKRRGKETYISPPKSTLRISLNVNANEDLIDALDKFMLENSQPGAEMYYKTPESESDWLERHDPITIYLEDDVPDAIKEELVRITDAFIRSREDVLPGEKIAGGVSLERSPSNEALQELIDRGYKINDYTGEAIKSLVTKDEKLKASAGQVTALEQFLEKYS